MKIIKINDGSTFYNFETERPQKQYGNIVIAKENYLVKGFFNLAWRCNNPKLPNQLIIGLGDVDINIPPYLLKAGAKPSIEIYKDIQDLQGLKLYLLNLIKEITEYEYNKN